MWLALVVFWIVLDLSSLAWLSKYITGFGTLLWVLGAACLGMWFIRMQGRWQLFMLRNETAVGEFTEVQLFQHLLAFIAGVLLIFPGVLSDVVALVLMIPAIQKYFAKRVQEKLRRAAEASYFSGNKSGFSYSFYSRYQNMAQPADNVIYDCTVNEPDVAAEQLIIDCEDGQASTAGREKNN